MAGSDLSLAIGANLLWRSGILHQPAQFTTNASAFGCYPFASLFPEHHQKSNEFERSEQTIVILSIDDDVIIRRQKLLTDSREGLLVQILTFLMQQVGLREIIGQHDKDDLIDDHRESTGGKTGQVSEIFELTVPLLCRGTQPILLPGLPWILNLLGIDLESNLLMAIGIALPVRHYGQGDATGGPTPKFPHARCFCL
jgi:hypothetical protein